MRARILDPHNMIPFSAATTVLAVKRYCIYCTYVILPVGARTCQSKSSLSTRVKIHFFNYDIVLITSAFSLRTFLYTRLQPKNVSCTSKLSSRDIKRERKIRKTTKKASTSALSDSDSVSLHLSRNLLPSLSTINHEEEDGIIINVIVV